MPDNRKLYITVNFNCVPNANGVDFGGTATYQQTTSVPNMGQIVDSNGMIHLDQAAAYEHTAYNQNVDIYFTLTANAPVQGTNSTTPVVWARVYGAGMNITVPPGGPSTGGEFSVITFPDQPNLILIKDNDDDSNTYNYKPAVELTAHNNYFITLDPQIVNRPP